jgi:hypothetical protein
MKGLVVNYNEARALVESKYDMSHGSYFDRGSADSYYGRQQNPHRGGVGGDSGPRIEATKPEDIQAYLAGYAYNEQFGDKKSWD